MCVEIEIYHGTDGSPARVISTIAGAVECFGLDAVRKHVTALGYEPTGAEKHCLCGIDIDALCVEAEYDAIAGDDPRWSAGTLAVLHPWSAEKRKKEGRADDAER